MLKRLVATLAFAASTAVFAQGTPSETRKIINFAYEGVGAPILAEGYYKDDKPIMHGKFSAHVHHVGDYSGHLKQFKYAYDGFDCGFVENGIHIDGLPDGPWTVTAGCTKNNASPVLNGSYKNGKPEGIWRSYYNAGILAIESDYKDGILISQKTFNRDGSVLKFVKYAGCNDTIVPIEFNAKTEAAQLSDENALSQSVKANLDLNTVTQAFKSGKSCAEVESLLSQSLAAAIKKSIEQIENRCAVIEQKCSADEASCKTELDRLKTAGSNEVDMSSAIRNIVSHVQDSKERVELEKAKLKQEIINLTATKKNGAKALKLNELQLSKTNVERINLEFALEKAKDKTAIRKKLDDLFKIKEQLGVNAAQLQARISGVDLQINQNSALLASLGDSKEQSQEIARNTAVKEIEELLKQNHAQESGREARAQQKTAVQAKQAKIAAVRDSIKKIRDSAIDILSQCKIGKVSKETVSNSKAKLPQIETQTQDAEKAQQKVGESR